MPALLRTCAVHSTEFVLGAVLSAVISLSDLAVKLSCSTSTAQNDMKTCNPRAARPSWRPSGGCQQHPGDTALEVPALHTIAHTERAARLQTGMLPILTELLPTLKSHDRAWLTHNVLAAPPVYKHAAHYTYASTLLSPGPLTAALLGGTSPWGALWADNIAWQRTDTASLGTAPPASALTTGAAAGNGTCSMELQDSSRAAAVVAVPMDGRVTPAKVTAWLLALAAHHAFPPHRPFVVITHHWATALPAWWRAVETLAARVPPHWLEPALEQLLGHRPGADAMQSVAVPNVPCTQHQATTAMLPTCPKRGSWPLADAKLATNKYDLGAIAAEMEACAALFAPRLPRALLAPLVAAAGAAGTAARQCYSSGRSVSGPAQAS